jgi:single-strand DNA-binding protein
MSYSNINRVVIVGRLTREPELRALPSGMTVCNLRIASNSTRKSAEGEYREKPSYFNVSVFGGSGESVHRYMRKGSRVAIDGRLEWREWETSEGVKRQAVDIVADSVEFLEHGGNDEGLNGSFDGDGDGDGVAGKAGPELLGVGSGIEDDVVF